MLIHNKKQFLLPDSHRSMSSFHAKIMEDGIMKLTIHDCKHSIQFKSDLKKLEEIQEAIEIFKTLSNGIIELMEFVMSNYAMNPNDKAFNLFRF